jgi:hypothetical protein
MTKEDKIKEVLGDLAINADENGWFNSSVFSPIDLGLQSSQIENGLNDFKLGKWRPKSLQGIEDNNGWIKISEKEDLPENESDCWFIHNEQKIKGNFIHNKFTCWFGHFGWKTISHYQLITVPKDYLY